jgi:hypothetical protein
VPVDQLENCLNAKDVAALLRVSTASAYRLMQQCEHIRLGRILRVTRSALDRFLKARTERGTLSPRDARREVVRQMMQPKAPAPIRSLPIRVVYPRKKLRPTPPG